MASINLIDPDCSTDFLQSPDVSDILNNNSYTPNLTHILNDEEEYDNESQALINESKYYDLNDLILKKDKFTNTFNTLSLNIESINAKWDLFESTISVLESYGIIFSVITLQETWLDIDPKIFELENFVSFDQPRTCSQHGGLKTFVRNNFTAKKLEIFDRCETFDGLFVEIKDPTSNKKIVIANIYKPPKNNNNNENIQTFINEISPFLDKFDANNNVIFCGDFNIDLLKINERDIFNQHFDNIITRGYLPYITNPTRFSKLSASLLDHIYVKTVSNQKEIFSGILTSKISDHLATICCIPLKSKHQKKPEYITTYANTKENHQKIVCELDTIDWNGLLKTRLCDNPDPNYNILINTISDIKNKYMHKKIVKFKPYKHKLHPWINEEIINNIKHKDKLYKKWKSTNTNNPMFKTYKDNFKIFSDKLKQDIFLAKRNHYSNLFFKYKSDIKNTWLTIKGLLNKNRSQNKLPSKFKFNDSYIHGDINIASKFNDFFANIGASLNAKIDNTNSNLSIEHFLQMDINTTFKFKYVHCKDIDAIIKTLQDKNSMGHDDLSLSFLKKISPSIIYPLSIIINQSLFKGIFPDALKIAKIIPIFKKDDNELFDNYRPISLLPAISKIFEKIISQQILEYFTKNNLIFSSQHGFRTKHSTETAAIELVDTLKIEIDKGHLPVSIFMDLSKAFDTIDHTILLKKLKFYGVDGISLELFKSYLTDRKQYVAINSAKSPLQSISTGVPQGSILGPLLFLIYINDIKFCSGSFTFLCFADDTTVTLSICPKDTKCKHCDSSTIDETFLNHELQKLYNWLCINKLALNTKKTKYMVFHTPQRKLHNSKKCSFLISEPSKIKINNIPIEKVKTHIFRHYSPRKHFLE